MRGFSFGICSMTKRWPVRRCAQLAELDRLSSEVSVQITGNPLARAESPVMLEGVRDGIDGAYIAETVTHMVTGGGRNGYMTRIDCKTRDGQKSRSNGRSGPG